MEKILYLHIGLPKTGTTSIQSYLYENRSELSQMGLFFPEPIVTVGHHAEALLFLRENYPDAVFHWHRQATSAADKNRGKLKQLIEKIDWNLSQVVGENKKLILSSEGIFEYFQSPEEISLFPKFFPEYTIKIIFYIRRIDKMVASAIMEYIKVHEPISAEVIDKIKIFRKRQQLDIPVTLQKWEEVIGRENVIMRSFERSQLKDGDAIADFMASIDPSYQVKGHSNIIKQNEAISLECAHFMAQTLSYPAWERSAKEAAIGAIIISSAKLRQISGHNDSLLSPNERQELLKKLAPTYEQLAKRYLKREDGKLFVEPVLGFSEEWEPFKCLTFENTKPIYDEIITTLYERSLSK